MRDKECERFMRPSVPESRTARARKLRVKPRLKLTWSWILLILGCISMPLALAYGMEFIQRGSAPEAWAWIVASPKLFALNALLNGLVLLALFALTRSLWAGAALSALLLGLMSFISYFKVKLIGEPFFPWDIFLNKESMNIMPLVANQAALTKIGGMALIVLLLLVLAWRAPRFKFSFSPLARLVVGGAALFTLYSFGVNSAWTTPLLYRAGASEIVWNQSENYGANGLSLAFTMNVKNAIVPKPAGYDEPAMATLAQTLQAADSGAARKASAQADPFGGQQPNVIFIMNEAFWDPTLLPNVTFSEDPIPTVHRLQKESAAGYLLSPQFGGGTSNVEYEVLTGQSMSFLPAGSVPYQQYISKPVPSLAGYFEEQGYKSMAIHSYEGWFWNRDNVYKQMGFESFMSKEQFVDPVYKGAFISDDEVSNQIIKQIDNTDKPMFIYTVTMQNHGPYDDNRYGANPIEAKGKLTAEAKNTLETYTQGVRDADASLQKLIDHFEQSGEPTVIVFYGDHLPMLGYDYDVYTQGGFIHTSKSEQWSLEELQRMHSVPFVTWSNVQLPKDWKPALSNSFLGAYMLNQMGMTLPPTLALNETLSQKVPGLLRNLVIDADEKLHQTVPDEARADVDNYRHVQYDELFGKQYLAKYLDSAYLQQAAMPNYNEEFAGQGADAALEAVQPSP